MVSVTGILMNVMMLILIIIVLFLGLGAQTNLNNCLNTESPFCFSVQCPCDPRDPDNPALFTAPCFGYASRPGPREGTFYCSSAPNQLVNSDGNPTR